MQDDLQANKPTNTSSNNHEFKFVGTGGEFFGIWIVNVLLSILTIGIYSAWAKVRNNKYIYGATLLDGIGFEYTANPIKILIGRLIVFFSYLAFAIFNKLHLETLAGIIGIVFFLILPWLVRQAMRFKMRYTRYRGIHFSHKASTWSYYKFFIIHGILLTITLGLALPYTAKEFNSLVINNSYYGNEKFNFEASASLFYIAYGKILASLILIFVLLIASIASLAGNKFSHLDAQSMQNMPPEMIAVIGGIFITIYFMTLFSGLIIQGLRTAWIGNIINNNTTLGNFSLNSTWKGLSLVGIFITNFFMLAFAFGLLYPWAKIRVIRYKISNLFIEGDNFDNFINANDEQTRALGEEAADFFDFDIGF